MLNIRRYPQSIYPICALEFVANFSGTPAGSALKAVGFNALNG